MNDLQRCTIAREMNKILYEIELSRENIKKLENNLLEKKERVKILEKQLMDLGNNAFNILTIDDEISINQTFGEEYGNKEDN